jgi:hypothetical protein
MSDNKLLCVFGIVIMITKLPKKKNNNKEKFLKFFEVNYVFIFFTIQIKMKRKARSVVKKKKPTTTTK